MSKFRMKSQIARLLRRKGHNTRKVYDNIENSFELIKMVNNMVVNGQLEIDLVNGTAFTTTKMYLSLAVSAGEKCMKKYKDENYPFIALCRAIRLWINYQRAYKLGDIERMAEQGEAESDKLPESRKRFTPLPDHQLFKLYIMGDNNQSVVMIDHACIGSEDKLRFHLMQQKDGKSDKGEASDKEN